MTTTLRQSLSESRAVLRVGGVAEWEVEAEALLRHVLGTDRANFLTLVYGGDGLLSSTQSDRLASLLDRRLSGEPLAYIVGTREFYSLELDVNEHVLIPASGDRASGRYCHGVSAQIWTNAYSGGRWHRVGRGGPGDSSP